MQEKLNELKKITIEKLSELVFNGKVEFEWIIWNNQELDKNVLPIIAIHNEKEHELLIAKNVVHIFDAITISIIKQELDESFSQIFNESKEHIAKVKL